MIIRLLILFIFLFEFSVYSQAENPNKTKTTYTIDVDGFQNIKLSKTKNNKYKGVLINHIQKLNFIGGAVKEKNKIDEKTVKKLMIELERIGINTIDKVNCWTLISDNEKFRKCQDSTISCLDGNSTYFKIKSNNSIREFDFDCLSYNEIIESYTSENRRKAIYILKKINSEIDLKNSFDKFISNLPNGSYSYYGISILRKGDKNNKN